MGEPTAIPLSVIVSALDCYVDKGEHGTWRLVFPELVIQWVARNSHNQQLSSFAFSVLGGPDIVKPSSINEKIFCLAFETLFVVHPSESSQHPKLVGEVLPFLADTQIARWHLCKRGNGIVPVPKISGTARPLQDVQQHGNRGSLYLALPSYGKWGHGGEIKATSTISFADSSFILDYMHPDNYLGCPTSDMSGWPDFVIKEHHNRNNPSWRFIEKILGQKDQC